MRTEQALSNLQVLSRWRDEHQARAGCLLSPRLVRLLQLLADGKDLQGAAAVLGVAYNSVRNYNVLIRQQLDAETVAHAIAIGFRLGLIE